MNDQGFGASVRALPGATSHPAAEAWHSDRFRQLQQRLSGAMATWRSGSRRSLIVLPSRSLDRWHEPPAETRSYEERLLSFLFELHDPDLELTYITSLPVAEPTIGYYLSHLPRRVRASARKRLRLIALGDARSRPLSEKLLERPRVLEQIRRTVADPRTAYVLPYNSTTLEREIALTLDIPVFGADPARATLGTKSGSRALFARARVPHPLGSERVCRLADAVTAICELRAREPALCELVIKLDQAVSGEGNAVLDLAGLPAPGVPGEDALIRRRLERLAPEANGVDPAEYLRKLASHGGIVEERITGPEVRSPSVQLEITAAGAVRLLSTHDQILDGPSGQRFAGCRFLADAAYAGLISALAHRVGERLVQEGVIGRLAIDFVVTRERDAGWRAFALEVNLRLGGTTHPYQTLAGLTGGSYDPGRASFTTRRGRAWHYVATDHLELPQLPALGQSGLLARAARSDLRFDASRGGGAVFHMLSSVEPLAAVGVTAMAHSLERANDLYAHVHSVLAGVGGRRSLQDGALPVRAALGTRGL